MDNDKDLIIQDTPLEELELQLLQEDNIDEINKIIDIFNLNIKKKEIVRSGKLSQLQDKISEQMAERIGQHGGEFSNKDLLDYFKVIQDTLNKQDNSLDSINTPAIQINQQNQVNISMMPEDNLNRDSKDRVTSAIRAILDRYSKEDIIDESPLDNITDETITNDDAILEEVISNE